MSSAALIWDSCIELFAVWRGCERVGFVVFDRRKRLVPCVCYIRFITDRATLFVSISIILLQSVIPGFQLRRVS